MSCFWIGLSILAAVILVAGALGYALHRRFRGMCRRVRAELTELVRTTHPEVQVVGEHQGNLVLRMPDGTERVWEMAEVYSAVARLPGLGRDNLARANLYRRASDAFFFPAPDPNTPLSRAVHGRWIRMQLHPPESLRAVGPVLHTPVAGLALVAAYSVQLADGLRYLLEPNLAPLGMDLPQLHRVALDNLRKDFPREVVATALAGGSGAAIQFHDSCDAARLLLVPEHLQAGQEVLALIPHSDMLLVMPAAARADPDKLRDGLRELLGHGHPPLLDRPVRVTRDGFQIVNL